jgi:hypothetical protein
MRSICVYVTISELHYQLMNSRIVCEVHFSSVCFDLVMPNEFAGAAGSSPEDYKGN